jgi:hypothetical protein
LARDSQFAGSDGEAETRPSQDSTAVDPDGASVVPWAKLLKAAVGGERETALLLHQGMH